MSDEVITLAQGEFLQVGTQADTYEEGLALAQERVQGVVLNKVCLHGDDADTGDWYLYGATCTVSPGGQQCFVTCTFRRCT